jgi:hypothetical protein
MKDVPSTLFHVSEPQILNRVDVIHVRQIENDRHDPQQEPKADVQRAVS